MSERRLSRNQVDLLNDFIPGAFYTSRTLRMAGPEPLQRLEARGMLKRHPTTSDDAKPNTVLYGLTDEGIKWRTV